MELTIAPREILQIDDARIIHRNFAGAATKYNREGNRNFSVVIESQEDADMLVEAGWNIKIRPPREEGESPFMYLPVKIKFNDRGPSIFLKSGNKVVELDEESVGMLDNIDFRSVDLDIRPYDSVVNGKAYRSAYLLGIHVEQEIDRFAARYTDEDDE